MILMSQTQSGLAASMKSVWKNTGILASESSHLDDAVPVFAGW